MPEMMSYIFSTLEANENAIRNQTRINRNFVLIAGLAAACMVVQHKRIKALELEITKIKDGRGCDM